MPNDPWLYGKNWDFGPLTLTDQQRAATQARVKELQKDIPAQSADPVWDKTKDFLWRHLTEQGRFQDAADKANAPTATPPVAPPVTSPSPVIASPATPVTKSPPVVPFESSPRKIDRPNPDELPTVDLPNTMDTIPYKIGIDDITLNPEKEVDPLQAKYDQLMKFFGNEDYSNPKQDKADAYAENDMRRTALLAQLAFASGLTSAGGGAWKDVGKGFADAGEVYGKGFTRYQNALQDSADRYQKIQTQKQSRSDAVKEASVKLYTTELQNERERAEKRRKEMFEFFEPEYKALTKSDEAGLGADPEKIEELQRRIWQSQHLGIPVIRSNKGLEDQ